MKRCFVALALTDVTRRALEEPQQNIYRLEPHARPTPQGNLHATLKFLGPTTDAQLAELKTGLAALAEVTPALQADVFGLGAFPDIRRPRAIYAALGPGREIVLALMGAVENVCVKLGFTAEPQARLPHVTIARIAQPRPSPRLEAWLQAHKPQLWGPVDGGAIVLYESKSRGGGSVYEPLARLPMIPA